ncbi:MAG TPA: response regulator [Polyangiaceae bacterium]|nr:response regulator [Polyangiaceae bacterium]
MAGKRTSEELEEELRRVQGELIALREVVDSIPHRVFWKDRNCIWMGGNRNLARDCGVESPRDLVGRTDHDFFAKEHADFFQECDREVMARGEPLLDIEEPQRRPDGSLAYLLTSKVPLRNPAGEVIGMAGIYVDITDRKRLEQERQEALRAAQAAAEAKSNFLAVVSHELRTPLSLILGPLESLLAKTRAEGRGSAELESVLRNALRLKDLVDDVLDFSKAEAGKMSVTWSRCDVGRLVGELVSDAAGAAQAQGVALRADLPPFEPVDCDPSLLRKIALNLMSNAIKFTPRGGSVTVSLGPSAGGESYELRVCDTGPGIGEAQVGRLFQRFEQADGTSTRAAEGTGLGLALVKEFAGLLGGEVGVETALGQGSTFWVRLPARREAPAGVEGEGVSLRTGKLRPGPEAPAVERAGRGALRVVVAEDSSDMREHVRDVLGDSCRVTLCANGALALKEIENERPDVVVSDVMMPGMDGFELTRKIRENPELRATPVILLTARAGAEAAAEGLEAGADDYVAKPFSGPELIARVRAAARLHALYRELDSSHDELRRAHEALRQAASGLAGMEELAVAGQLALEAREALASKKVETKRQGGAPADLQDALAILDRVTMNLHSLRGGRPQPHPDRGLG